MSYSPSDRIDQYVLEEALYKGEHADMTIRAFDKDYKLHKLFLKRSPVLRSMILWNRTNSGQTSSSSNLQANKTDRPNYYTIQSDDPYVTQESFELTLKRLYFNTDYEREHRIPFQMITVGKYLGMTDLVEDTCDFLTKIMNMRVVTATLNYFHKRDFSEIGFKMIEICKFYLIKNGWENGPDNWDDIPVPFIAQVVGQNYFFVPNEFDRAIFIIKLIERRIERDEDHHLIRLLKDVLNNEVFYYHIPVDKLRQLETFRDIHGKNYISKNSIAFSVWEIVRLMDKMSFTQGAKINYVSELHTEMTREFGYFHKSFGFNSIPSEVEKYIIGMQTSGEVYKTQIPPLRISVAFPNLSQLDDSILSSKPFFYLGSYWALALARRQIEGSSRTHVKLMIGRTIDKRDLFREWRVDGQISDKPRFINIDEGNINHLFQPKDYPDYPKRIEVQVRDGTEDSYDYQTDTRVDFSDRRHEVYSYATFYSPFNNEKAEIQIKNYTTRTFKDYTYKWVTWDVFNEDGTVKRGLDTFKVSLVLGLV